MSAESRIGLDSQAGQPGGRRKPVSSGGETDVATLDVHDRVKLNLGKPMGIWEAYGAHDDLVGQYLSPRRGRPAQASRALVRSLVTIPEHEFPALPHTRQGAVKHMEAAIPLGGDEYVVYLATNAPNRRSPKPTSELVQSREATVRRVSARRVSPAELVAQKHAAGYDLTTRIDSPGQVYDLWERTFGWSPQDEMVEQFQEDIERQASQPPAERHTWFGGVVDRATKQLVSAAIVEGGLKFGDTEIQESSEYSTLPDYKGQGLVVAAAAVAHAQAIQDRGSRRAIIMGEFRDPKAVPSAVDLYFSTPELPPGGRVPQVLEQNIGVGNGAPADHYDDFHLKVLTPGTIAQHYSPAATRAILSLTGGR